MTTKHESYALTGWIFLRAIGFIYLIAFISFYVQYKGLIGQEGILPFNHFLNAVKSNFGNSSYLIFPAINWINISDQFMHWHIIISIIISFLLITGILPIVSSTLLWVSYLSIVNVGQIFMSYQWDVLLLETGFLCIFISSYKFISKPSNAQNPSPILIFLFKILLFKLILSSGIGKLLSGDETWRNLTALDFHYFTQPIPNPVSWYIHQLPHWFHKLSVLITLFIEIIVPFFFFGPRKLRYLAGFILILFQLLIIATGNYTFFNLLTISLCIFLYEDRPIKQLIHKNGDKIVNKYRNAGLSFSSFNVKEIILIIFATIILLINLLQFSRRYMGLSNIPQPLLLCTRYISAFHIVNNYGLFTVMTTKRPEIIIEGSNDGKSWLAYEFSYKPGDSKKPLSFVAPHQPRLDWQMWFAALGNFRSNPWIINLLFRIQSGSEDVIGLFKKNPFPDKSPAYLRASLYEYTFTTMNERKETGNIWNKKYKGFYLPINIQ